MDYDKVFVDYDRIFEGNLDRKFFYTDYPGYKMMVGKISLKNAVERLSKNEYYTFVTYTADEELPKQYIPLSELTTDDGTLIATVNPNTNFYDMCIGGGIQRISRLPNSSSGSPRYLLGPGPETISLEELVMKQYDEYLNTKSDSVIKGR